MDETQEELKPLTTILGKSPFYLDCSDSIE
jgi:hypothetical protein